MPELRETISRFLFIYFFSMLRSPHGARVSGVVEETPGRLEYEVALYKEAPTRLSNLTNSELPVDQAVPIGTKLQLRARISPHSGTYFGPHSMGYDR